MSKILALKYKNTKQNSRGARNEKEKKRLYSSSGTPVVFVNYIIRESNVVELAYKLSVCSSLEHLQQPTYVVTKDITHQHSHYVKETWRGERSSRFSRTSSAVVNGICFDVTPTHPMSPWSCHHKTVDPCNSPHLTAMPPSSYLREVWVLKGARTHWPNWR